MSDEILIALEPNQGHLQAISDELKN